MRGLTALIAGTRAILNCMVQYLLDDTLSALADPTRRAVLERLGCGPATISELAEPFGISLTGMNKHVRVLENVGLVRTAKAGRARSCTLGTRRLEELETFIDDYRRMLDGQLDRLGELLRHSKGDGFK